jgi:hypothetical protein
MFMPCIKVNTIFVIRKKYLLLKFSTLIGSKSCLQASRKGIFDTLLNVADFCMPNDDSIIFSLS